MLIKTQPTRILMPVPKFEWREPSLALPKDQFGRQNRTRFKIELWVRDGGLADRRVFEDRDEFDYELWRVLQDPQPHIVPLWAAVTTITANAGSLQSLPVPSDWNSGDNFVELLGGGGSGRAVRTIAATRQACGGGGAGYGRYDNLTLTPGGSTSYQIGLGGVARVLTTNTSTNGANGGDSWLGGADYAAAPVGGKFGSGGSASGGAGGIGKGSSFRTGARGGDNTSGASVVATGAGGAAGRNANGGQGVDMTGAGGATGGGDGDGGAGGAGGALGGNNGGNGTNMDGIGPGGGGGGNGSGSGGATAGSGGDYGAGGGACYGVGGTVASGAGAQGALWLTWTPLLMVNGGFFSLF